MPARPSFGRQRLQALPLMGAAAGLALLSSCASPVYQRSGGVFATSPPLPPPVLDIVQVHELRGSATVQSGTQRLALKPESEVHENQPVQVGPRSTLRLALGQRALLDLGPNSRVVIHKLPRDGKGEERATWLRLEQGYLRVVWSDERGDTPMEVSFGRWAARVGPGEHFFDSRGNSASACSTSGTLTLSGVPEWTPKSLSEPCVKLEPHRAPVEIALREKDWKTLRTKRRLQPTLARAADQQATQAVARLDRNGMRSVAWKPATSPGAFAPNRLAAPPAPEAATYFPHTPPVIQIPAPPSAPVEQAAFVPEAPPLIYTEPQQVTVISPDDVPVVQSTAEPPVALASTAPMPEFDTARFSAEPSAPAALMEAAPPGAGVAAPALKWTDDLQMDTSSLQPVTTAPAASPTIEADPAPPTSATPPETATAFSEPQDSGAIVVPAPEPPALPLPAEGDRAEWIVNVATYADPELAQQHVQQLVAQGFNATLRQETVRGRSSYRVVIEGLPTESAAQSAVSDLGTRHGVRSAWAMRKR